MIPYLLTHPDFLKRENKAEEMLLEHNLSRAHPDLLWFDSEAKLGIEQARQIKDFLNLKPYQGDKHAVVIITAENLTPDAQNTLLKTLEEPPGETVMILGTSSEDQLLPTIISRCQIIDLKISSHLQNLDNKYEKEIEKLLNADMETRFQYIEKLKERDDFLPALTSYFRQQLLKTSLGGASIPLASLNPAKGGRSGPLRWNLEESQNFLKNLIEAEKWAKSNVNIRAILEYLMLKMPQG